MNSATTQRGPRVRSTAISSTSAGVCVVENILNRNLRHRRLQGPFFRLWHDGASRYTAIRRGVMAARQPLKLEVQDRDLAAEHKPGLSGPALTGYAAVSGPARLKGIRCRLNRQL